MAEAKVLRHGEPTGGGLGRLEMGCIDLSGEPLLAVAAVGDEDEEDVLVELPNDVCATPLGRELGVDGGLDEAAEEDGLAGHVVRGPGLVLSVELAALDLLVEGEVVVGDGPGFAELALTAEEELRGREVVGLVR